MDAASLIKLAAAKGIDLNHIAGVASDLSGVAAQRKLTIEEKKYRIKTGQGLEVSETVRGRESRTYRRPTWSVAELGQAAKGMGVIPWTAAMYSYAGAKEGYWRLWDALSGEARRISNREFWPPRIASEDGRMLCYREQLSLLVLDEDASKHLFLAAPILYPAYMGVTLQVWERQLFGPFVSLKSRYEGWLGTARATIAKWICEPTHAESVDNSSACV